ncbi:MAG TPA: hypothetical protein VFR37_05385 [Longimicrobium sp.]|nr:hypothetical protein [Longimicrobium sp.]
MMIPADDDFLFCVVHVVECGGALRFDHEPGCTCMTDDEEPVIDAPEPDKGELPF